MSYKIVQPSTNSDRVGRFGVSAGTSDSVITFPTDSGEVATTSDIPNITVPPATIYQTNQNDSDLESTSTTYETVPGTTVTGLESNYLYRLTLIGEISNADGGSFVNNFKIRARTAGGNIPPSQNNTDNLWLAYDGGVQVNLGDGYTAKIFPPNYLIWQNFGWNLRENESNGTGAKLNLRLLYNTGTTADQRSVSFEFALSAAATSVRWYGGYTTLILEPIKSVSLQYP